MKLFNAEALRKSRKAAEIAFSASLRLGGKTLFRVIRILRAKIEST